MRRCFSWQQMAHRDALQSGLARSNQRRVAGIGPSLFDSDSVDVDIRRRVANSES